MHRLCGAIASVRPRGFRLAARVQDPARSPNAAEPPAVSLPSVQRSRNIGAANPLVGFGRIVTVHNQMESGSVSRAQRLAGTLYYSQVPVRWPSDLSRQRGGLCRRCNGEGATVPSSPHLRVSELEERAREVSGDDPKSRSMSENHATNESHRARSAAAKNERHPGGHGLTMVKYDRIRF